VDAYRLRPARPADADELFRIHWAAMSDYLKQAFGEDWSEEVDRPHHAEWMRSGRAQVIEVAGRIAGSLDVLRDDDSLWLARIELDPRLHGRGLGGSIVRDLQEEARRNGLTMVLDVFENNPARRLYERLGFREVGRDGPSITMAWAPR
jgi:GNAT superfamily N-acetyltransferase